jgi:bis(5'-nucleosyl)-tetraphosphatase (symmetrical)
MLNPEVRTPHLAGAERLVYAARSDYPLWVPCSRVAYTELFCGRAGPRSLFADSCFDRLPCFDMATYVIGDVHGCCKTLRQLLDTANISEGSDQLWFVGDLVNRGPGNVQVLQFVQALGDYAHVVLGNHDLHLLALHYGVTQLKRKDTLDDVLSHPDRRALVDWLRHQPLFHGSQNAAMVHAGVWPGWSLGRAAARAEAVQRELVRDDPRDFLHWIVRERGICPVSEAPGTDDLCTTVTVLTRMRALHRESLRLNHDFKSTRADMPDALQAWCDARQSTPDEPPLFFGHWAALGVESGPGWQSLDSGCVWGQSLTMMRLDDGAMFQVPTSPEDR